MDKIAITYFTWSGDADECLLSASILEDTLSRTEMDYTIFIMEDVFNPMDADLREQMKAKGWVVDLTSWERNGNLLGQSAILGITTLYSKLLKMGYSHVYKTDPDCALISTDWWDLSYPMVTPCFQNSPTYGFGGGYLLQLEWADAIKEDLERIPCHHTAFEDYEIPTRLIRVTNNLLSIKRYPMGAYGFAQFEASNPPMPPETLLQCRSVTFGFNKGRLGCAEDEKQCRLTALTKTLEMVQARE